MTSVIFLFSLYLCILLQEVITTVNTSSFYQLQDFNMNSCLKHDQLFQTLPEQAIEPILINDLFQSKFRTTRTPHDYPFLYSSPIDWKYNKTQFCSLQNIGKEEYLIKQIDYFPEEKETAENALIHNIIHVNELLAHCYNPKYEIKRQDRINLMDRILNKFFILFSIDPLNITSLEANVFALFSVFNNPDAFQIKTNSESDAINQYDQLFTNLTNLYHLTYDSNTQSLTNKLILGTMTLFIDLLFYEEKDRISENNMNNPINNIAKNKTTFLIQHLPKFATRKFCLTQISEGLNHFFSNNFFIFDVYDINSISYQTNSYFDITIKFNPFALIDSTEFTKKNIIYLAVYGYFYYPKFSINTTDYNQSFIGIKGYDKNFNELSVNYMNEEIRPEIQFLNVENATTKYCYFFNEEDFNPFSNVGIKQEMFDSILKCNVSMLRDFTYGERQTMRLIWIGVLAGISLFILIILFILFMKFRKIGNDADQNNAFAPSRLSRVF